MMLRDALLLASVLLCAYCSITPIGKYGWAVVTTLGETIEFDCILKENGTDLLPKNTTVVAGSYRWLFPGAPETVGPSNDDGNKLVRGDKLHIRNITRDDEGIYLCYMELECASSYVTCANQTYLWTKHGLNLNGPVYANIMDKYRWNFIYGASAAGGVLALILLPCLIYKFRYKQPKEMSEDYELPNEPAINGNTNL